MNKSINTNSIVYFASVCDKLIAHANNASNLDTMDSIDKIELKALQIELKQLEDSLASSIELVNYIASRNLARRIRVLTDKIDQITTRHAS